MEITPQIFNVHGPQSTITVSSTTRFIPQLTMYKCNKEKALQTQTLCILFIFYMSLQR